MDVILFHIDWGHSGWAIHRFGLKMLRDENLVPHFPVKYVLNPTLLPHYQALKKIFNTARSFIFLVVFPVR